MASQPATSRLTTTTPQASQPLTFQPTTFQPATPPSSHHLIADLHREPSTTTTTSPTRPSSLAHRSVKIAAAPFDDDLHRLFHGRLAMWLVSAFMVGVGICIHGRWRQRCQHPWSVLAVGDDEVSGSGRRSAAVVSASIGGGGRRSATSIGGGSSGVGGSGVGIHGGSDSG
ncbi:hypothetical protein Dimus_035711 [Dionaea muscipula]